MSPAPLHGWLVAPSPTLGNYGPGTEYGVPRYIGRYQGRYLLYVPAAILYYLVLDTMRSTIQYSVQYNTHNLWKAQPT